MNSKNLKKAVVAALFAALTAVATLISIPLPGNGYANAGDCMVILSGAILGAFGIPAAAIGSCIADVILGFAFYAPATFITKAAMAGTAFALLCKGRVKHLSFIFTCILCEGIMLICYFLYEALLYGVPAAAGNLLGNCVQALFSLLVTPLLYSVLKRSGIINKIKGEL